MLARAALFKMQAAYQALLVTEHDMQDASHGKEDLFTRTRLGSCASWS